MIAARVLVTAILVLLIALPVGAAGQEAEWKRHREASVKAYNAGRNDRAVLAAKNALDAAEKFGRADWRVALSASHLARLYKITGNYQQSENLFKRAISILSQVFGARHESVAFQLGYIGDLYVDTGRYEEAEQVLQQSLQIIESTVGLGSNGAGNSSYYLANLFRALGRYPEAEPLYKRSISISENAHGPGHLLVGTRINGLALLYKNMGQLARAEPLYRRAVKIFTKSYGENHLAVGISLNNLADLYFHQGKYQDAESLHKRALEIRERSLGAEHPSIGSSLNNLALVYEAQGRRAEGLPFLRRALLIQENAFGADNLETRSALVNLANFLRKLGRGDEADRLFQRALKLIGEGLGEKHPHYASVLNNIALLYQDRERYSDAEKYLRRSIALRDASGSQSDIKLAAALSNLAGVLRDQEKHEEAIVLVQRALSLEEASLGREHPQTSTSYYNLAHIYADTGQIQNALNYIRRGTSVRRKRAAVSTDRSAGARIEQQRNREGFLSHLEYLSAALQNKLISANSIVSESFEIGQLAAATSAGAAVSSMSARFAAGNDRLARLVRARQDAVLEWQALDKSITDATSLPAKSRSGRALKRQRALLSELDLLIGDLDRQLVTEFPEYAELTSRRPVSLDEIQKLLKPDEALIAFTVSDDETFVWTVRRKLSMVTNTPHGAAELSDAVQNLREGLEPFGIESQADIPPFDTTAAFKLYQQIFMFAEERLEGVRHVFVVPDGALQSLPLGVLVTEEPQSPIEDFAGYQKTPWLAKKYALTTLPSVSSLRALRRFAKTAKSSKPFIGIGDPALKGAPGNRRGVQLASLFGSRGIADVDRVRNIPSLPDTAQELTAIAESLGVGRGTLLMRGNATETVLKATDFSDYKVIAFATHGLVAGDLKGLAEPALVLTPPAKGTSKDDGLFTASEAAQLNLDADLVILSACNTASPDGTPGAEALSGLAKAFLYAGSRALLVSHWPVVSGAAVRLTTKMLDLRAKSPNLRRATALQQSMLALMADKKDTFFAHPMFWAPFVIVGEGG